MLKSEELEDAKPKQMDTESMMEVLKGSRFRFALNHQDFKDYLIEARKISEKILKRTTVNI